MKEGKMRISIRHVPVWLSWVGPVWKEKKTKNSSIARMYEPVGECRDFVDSKEQREILRRLNITFCLDNNRWSIHRVKASVTVSRIQRLRLRQTPLHTGVCVCLFTAFHKTVPGATDLLCTNALNSIYIDILYSAKKEREYISILKRKETRLFFW